MTKEKKTTAAPPPEERFEDQLARLEEVVARLEDDDVGLEEAVELFEHGMALAGRCRARLEAVEQRVSRLLEGESGDRTEPMDVETT